MIFIPRMHIKFNIWKSIDVVCHIKLKKRKVIRTKYMIICTDIKKAFEKI